MLKQKRRRISRREFVASSKKVEFSKMSVIDILRKKRQLREEIDNISDEVKYNRQLLKERLDNMIVL